jgi:hypothetical protein
VTKEQIIEEAKVAVQQLVDTYKPKLDECRNLQQFSELIRAYQNEKALILLPFVEQLMMLPPDPLIAPSLGA